MVLREGGNRSKLVLVIAKSASMGDRKYWFPSRPPFEPACPELSFGEGAYVDTTVTTGDDDRTVFKFEVVTLQIV